LSAYCIDTIASSNSAKTGRPSTLIGLRAMNAT
jgi:hypothetical protein